MKSVSKRTHPKGERVPGALSTERSGVAVDTYGGRVHVEWDPDASVTPFGQLPFFIKFLT